MDFINPIFGIWFWYLGMSALFSGDKRTERVFLDTLDHNHVWCGDNANNLFL